MHQWTPLEYQQWWSALLSPYRPWLILGVCALVVDALCSLAMVVIWLRGGLR